MVCNSKEGGKGNQTDSIDSEWVISIKKWYQVIAMFLEKGHKISSMQHFVCNNFSTDIHVIYAKDTNTATWVKSHIVPKSKQSRIRSSVWPFIHDNQIWTEVTGYSLFV